MKKKILDLEQKSSDDEQETESDDSSDDEEKWDAETILTTYTNKDNHPTTIKFVKKIKANKKL